MPSPASLLLVPVLLATIGVAHPEAAPEPEAQNWDQNAPFSGAIYLVSPNGQQVQAQGNYCPSYASVSCNTINQPSWCCPSDYTCASPANSNGLIGCCPAGSSCGGVVYAQAVTTVTVQAQQNTAVVYAQPPTTVYVNPNPTHVQAGGFCATITMDGPGLPRAEEGSCGTILIVSKATPTLTTLGVATGILMTMLHLAAGIMFT